MQKRLQVEILTALKYYPRIFFLFSFQQSFNIFWIPGSYIDVPVKAKVLDSRRKMCTVNYYIRTDVWKSRFNNCFSWNFLNTSFHPPVRYRSLMTCFPLAGLNPNMNVKNMDITGGLSVKDTSQSQSRLPQWTHPNSMDNLSSAASSLDQNSSKHGMSPLISVSGWLFGTGVILQL